MGYNYKHGTKSETTIESTEEGQKIDKLEWSLSLKEGWTLHSCPFLSEEMLQFAHHFAAGIWAQSTIWRERDKGLNATVLAEKGIGESWERIQRGRTTKSTYYSTQVLDWPLNYINAGWNQDSQKEGKSHKDERTKQKFHLLLKTGKISLNFDTRICTFDC